MSMKLKVFSMLFFMVFTCSGVVAGEDVPNSESSFSEISDYFNMEHTEVKPNYKYDKRSLFKITARERDVMHSRFGNDFYIVEFFVSVYKSDLFEIREAAEYILELRRDNPNIVVKCYIVAKTAEYAMSSMVKNIMENKKLVVIKDLSPVIDVLAFEASARGVNYLPSLVVTKGYGKEDNVIIFKSDYKKNIKNMLDLKIRGVVNGN